MADLKNFTLYDDNGRLTDGAVLWARNLEELQERIDQGITNATQTADPADPAVKEDEIADAKKTQAYIAKVNRDLTSKIDETKTSVSDLDRALAAQGTNVGGLTNRVTELENGTGRDVVVGEDGKLHITVNGQTIGEGADVSTDLTDYATIAHVENRLNVGSNTVKGYVDQKVASIDISGQLANYYTKPQVDIMDVDIVDQGQTIGIALRGADGVLGEYHSFPKATNSEYYRITPVTADTFNTIPGNDKTPQKIQYKAGHMRGESGWGNELYFERWTTQVNDITTNTITRSNYFIDITGDNSQEFDFIPYLGNGTTAITLEIFATNDYATSFKASYTWKVTKVNFDLSVAFPGPQECGVNSTITCTLPSGTGKRLDLYLDGVLHETVNLAANVISHDFVLTSSEHGAKLAQINMETTMDGQVIPAIPQSGSLVWYDKNNDTPILALRQTSYNAKQYDIVPITFLPYAYFNGSDKNDLNLKIYSNETGAEVQVADETVTSSIAYTWSYPAEKIMSGIRLKLVLSHSQAAAEKTVTLNVTDGDYNFAPVSGDNFSFIPRNYSNNSFTDNSLTISEGVTLTLSDNFNLNSGGFRKEGETTYFKIPAYNKVRISGKGIFNTSHDSHFKLVFKTANARYNDVVFLTTGTVDDQGEYTATASGLQLTTNHGYVIGNETVRATSVFTTEEVIDYAFNVVNPTKHDNKTYTTANEGKIPAGYREGDYKDLTLEKYMIMPYEDGVASLPAVYTENIYKDGFFEDVGDCIEIGSNDCDVYIYTIRSYTKALGIDDICKNFVADGTTLLERRERYDRNNWNVLSNNILKDPELAAKILPEVKIVLITAPKFTNDKKDKVEDTYIQVLQNTVTRTVNGKLEPVDVAPFNWITKGGRHSGQGTSSNAYGFSGRNLSLFLGDVVYEGATSIYSPTNASHGTLENFATVKGWTLKDEAKIKIKPDSIPADIFNIKVNIASSENANNALMAMMYDKLNNEVYKRPAKLRDPNVKDTIEFDNCLIYVRETDSSPANRREFLVEDSANTETWHFYGIGNFGDHKDTDATRIDNIWDKEAKKWVSDPKETIVEILDYNVPLAGFNNYQQRCGIEPFNHDSAGITEKEYVHLQPNEYWTFDNLLTYKTNIPGDGEHYGLYEYDSKKSKWKFEGFGVMSKASKVEPKEGENYYEEELECSYEFRYEDENVSKTQRDENILLWNEFYRKIYQLYTSLDNKTLTVDQVKKELGKYMIVDSAVLYHIFTERYSLIDNRAKNSFWHYSKKYYSKTEAAGLDSTQYASMINDAEAATNGGYRWDLCFGYDFDTSLGIDNVGKLVFEYGQETSSREFRTEVKYVENGEVKTSNGFSYFFELINNFGYETLSEIYNKTDTTATLFDSTSINGTIYTWDKSQKQIPEKVWLRDIERKYLRTSGDFQLDGSITSQSTGGYPKATLDMKAIDTSFLIDKANGLKRYHRHDFEKKQSIYMASRWAEGSRAGYIDFRFASGSAPGKVVVGFGQKCYFSTTTELSGSNWTTPAVSWTNKQDGTVSYIKEITLTNAECLRIYPASEIQIIRFPSTYSGTIMKINQALNFTPAKKIIEVSLGTTDGTQPEVNISEVSFEGCPLLEKLNLTNCIKYSDKKPEEIKPEDREYSLSFASNLGFRELLAEGSGLVGASFAPNGVLATVKLNKAKKLSFINLNQLTTLSVKDVSSLASLRLENCPKVDSYSLVSRAKNYLTELRLIGVDWREEQLGALDITTVNIFDTLGTKKGIRENGLVIEVNDPEKPGYKGSVISGYVEVIKASSRVESKYKSWWPELAINYEKGSYIKEYKIEFCNYNPATGENTLLIGEPYWVEENKGMSDPIGKTMDTPTRAPDNYNVYTFAGWNSQSFTNGVRGDMTREKGNQIYATYTPEDRYYTITWKLHEGDLNPTTAQVKYREGLAYPDGIPSRPSDFPNARYYHFKGWDNYTYSVTDDVTATAIFEEVVVPETPPDPLNKPLLDDYSVGEIASICGYGQYAADSRRDEGSNGISMTEEDYFDLGSTIEVEIGWDPDDERGFSDNVLFNLKKSPFKTQRKNGTVIAQYQEGQARPETFTLNHTGANDEPAYIDTGIKLFGADSPEEFSIILDYRFNDKYLYTGNFGGPKDDNLKIEQVLFSCAKSDKDSTPYKNIIVERNSNNNFQVVVGNTAKTISSTVMAPTVSPVYMTSNKDLAQRQNPTGVPRREVGKDADDNPTYTYNVDWSMSRADRVIIQKKAGVNKIEIYATNPTYALDELKSPSNGGQRVGYCTRYEVNLTGENHENTLLLGAHRNNENQISELYLANATLENLKIYPRALSDIEIAKASLQPKEKLLFWLTNFPRISATSDDGRNWYSTDTNPSNKNNLPFPGITLELRDFLKNTRPYEGYNANGSNNGFPNNYDGWDDLGTRAWLSERIYPALPDEWKSVIKPVRVYYLHDENLAANRPTGTYQPEYVSTFCVDNVFNPSVLEYVNKNSIPTALKNFTSLHLAEGDYAPDDLIYDNNLRRKYVRIGNQWFNGYNRTRSPLAGVGYWRIAPDGGISQGSTRNHECWVTFAFCV